MKSSTHIQAKWVISIASTLFLTAVPACSQNRQSTNQQSRMILSTGRFEQGRNDGIRDAKFSWSDDNAAWMWLWMMEEEYRRGYDIGWSEGRAEVNINKRPAK